MTTPRCNVRLSSFPLSTVAGLVAFCLATLVPKMTETAVANGDTRTIHLYHAHTHESISATYLVNGQYDTNVLQQLNWFLRDWRRDEPTNMDPRLFDVVWEAYRHAGAGDQVVNVVSAYRSPETNAMLRARSRAVAKYSQHMLGKAMDTTMPGMPMSQIREIGMRMQRGGVGYYPNAGTPFVHLDVGNVRHWPRMTYDELARLFPDGKTVHLPTNNQPLARYEEARAEIEARGNGAYVVAPRRSVGNFFAMLFGGGSGAEEDDAEITAPAPSTRKQWASLAPRPTRGETDEQSAVAETGGYRYGAEEMARAQADLPRGETAVSAPPESAEQELSAKLPTVRAPLPPHRPNSLAARLAREAAPGESAADAESRRPGELRSSGEFQQAKARDRNSSASAMDTPARRSKLSSAPLPPSRPSRPTAKATSAIARLVDSPKNEKKSKSAAHESLAYAPEPSEPARATDQNARNTANAAAEEPAARGAATLLGSSTGLRSAARSRGSGKTTKEAGQARTE